MRKPVALTVASFSPNLEGGDAIVANTVVYLMGLDQSLEGQGRSV